MNRWLALLAVLVAVVTCHDVIGTIINSTPYYMDLTKSEVKHGHTEYLPAIRLDPYAYTNFTMSSNTIGDNHIEYKFAYTPETTWCPEQDPPAQEAASYDYDFGSNSCDGTSVHCESNGMWMNISYNECSTFWGTSQPTYEIRVTS
uniref:Uncharacterized protein n=1 Tax=Paramoeba aestuarina TaxID=180227 RepID=A0A7S4UTJ1_9EUKA|eukprot:CAMPEP_0201514948 /NCGR_PEP_ID=MMETSP0161_2-20130828/6649_1 /ASSEMBLY_ACC=CAM_ASM_000251 /TAXON_ID=180227 /ORGANISM="Neoparamoeba aestuarina, Strain SoJaBio B1-5/56/2" /LENGTH=145 /DNA_ID=CAMNT_0047911643 /DNA_START=52 /DNA_END=489 /DNA_ORIENTATION=-